MRKIIRTSTVPLSLKMFCCGLLEELSAEYEVVALSSPGKELDDIARAEHVRTIGVPMRRKISPVADLLSLLRLIRTFRTERPDMVHSMTPKAGLLSMVAARVAKVPVRVHTFTGLVFPTSTGMRKRILMLADRITCACATHIVAEGKGVCYDLERYHITDRNVWVLGHGNVRGIDLAHYDRTPEVMRKAAAVRTMYGIPSDSCLFIFVGRIVRDKGIDGLVVAFSRLSQEHGGVHLLLVGDEEAADPILPSTRIIIERAANIHHASWQDDVRPWYAAADALVFPSHREGFPNVVIEAGAMGLPSIVTDINGSREIIRNGENGMIVPPCDEERLFEAMDTLLSHKELRDRLAGKARRMVAARYEQGYVRQCLKDFYHDVMQ